MDNRTSISISFVFFNMTSKNNNKTYFFVPEHHKMILEHSYKKIRLIDYKMHIIDEILKNSVFHRIIRAL